MFAALAFAWLLAGCDPIQPDPLEPPPADEQLEQLVPALIDAVQAKQPEFLMEHVAESFHEDGGLDHGAVRSIVDSFAFRDDEVGARLLGVEVAPQGDGSARVAARVAFALGRRLDASGELPPSAVTYAFDLIFARSGPRWLAQSGSYRRE